MIIFCNYLLRLIKDSGRAGLLRLAAKAFAIFFALPLIFGGCSSADAQQVVTEGRVNPVRFDCDGPLKKGSTQAEVRAFLKKKWGDWTSIRYFSEGSDKENGTRLYDIGFAGEQNRAAFILKKAKSGWVLETIGLERRMFYSEAVEQEFAESFKDEAKKLPIIVRDRSLYVKKDTGKGCFYSVFLASYTDSALIESYHSVSSGLPDNTREREESFKRATKDFDEMLKDPPKDTADKRFKTIPFTLRFRSIVFD